MNNSPPPIFFIMMWLFEKCLIKCILSLICISSSCSCLFGGAAGMALLRLHSSPDPINPMNFYLSGVCVQACTQGTIIPMDTPDIPPRPPPCQVYLKPTSVNHIQFISPYLSFLHPAHPHDTHSSIPVYNIITMQLFG